MAQQKSITQGLTDSALRLLFIFPIFEPPQGA